MILLACLAVLLSFSLGIIAPLAFDFWRARRHLATERYVMPAVEAAMEKRNLEMLRAVGKRPPAVESPAGIWGVSEVSDEELQKDVNEPVGLLEAAMGREAPRAAFAPGAIPPSGLGLLALALGSRWRGGQRLASLKRRPSDRLCD